MNAIWTTDIHLNFLEEKAIRATLQTWNARKADALLIAGDISEAPSLEQHLRLLEELISCPIYFVLGNHDYYRGSITDVRQTIRKQFAPPSRIVWLGATEVSMLGNTALVGVDGWGDASVGNVVNTPILLNDFIHIKELQIFEQHTRMLKLQELGHQEAEALRQKLSVAVQQSTHICVLTHVPPFREVSLGEDGQSDDDWTPYFVCDQVGDVLRDFASKFNSHSFLVLAGHSHTAASAHILPNLDVRIGGAAYEHPQVQECLQF